MKKDTFYHMMNGSIEPLTSDQVEIADDKKTVTFVGLSQNDVKGKSFCNCFKIKSNK